jgi:hypothetical protein
VQQLSGELSVAPSPMTADAQIAHGRARLALGEALETLPDLVAADRYWSDFAPNSRWAGYAAFWLGRCQDALGHRVQAHDAYARALRALGRSPLPSERALVKLAQDR